MPSWNTLKFFLLVSGSVLAISLGVWHQLYLYMSRAGAPAPARVVDVKVVGVTYNGWNIRWREEPGGVIVPEIPLDPQNAEMIFPACDFDKQGKLIENNKCHYSNATTPRLVKNEFEFKR